MAGPRSGKKGSAWESTFPVNAETSADSTTFCKRAMYVTFAQIARFRNLLVPSAFKKRRVEDLRVNVLDTTHPHALHFARVIKGASDCLGLKYLRELQLLVHDNTKDEVIEVFKLRVNYVEDETSLEIDVNGTSSKINYKGPDFVKNETKELLVRLSKIMSLLQPLPENTSHSFYLIYDDERTPKGYQADCFQRCPEPYKVDEEIQGVPAGLINAGKHSMNWNVQSIFIDDSVEFEERLTGDHAEIFNQYGSNNNSTMDTSMDESILVDATRNIALNASMEKKSAEKKKATTPQNVSEADTPPTPEEEKRRAKGRQTPSPTSLKVKKTIKRTPGGSTKDNTSARRSRA